MKKTNTKTYQILSLFMNKQFHTYKELGFKAISGGIIRRMVKEGILEKVGSTDGHYKQVVFGITQLGVQYYLNNYRVIIIDDPMPIQKKSKFQILKESITKCYQNLVKMI